MGGSVVVAGVKLLHMHSGGVAIVWKCVGSVMSVVWMAHVQLPSLYQRCARVRRHILVALCCVGCLLQCKHPSICVAQGVHGRCVELLQACTCLLLHPLGSCVNRTPVLKLLVLYTCCTHRWLAWAAPCACVS
jgi:hypothetical protein